MTDRTFIGTLIEPHQVLRTRAILLAASAWDVAPLEINTQEYVRLTIYGDYARGGAAGACDIYVQWSPHQDANVPAGDLEWYPVMALEANAITPGTAQVTELQEAYFRFQPTGANQQGLAFDLAIPSASERVRVFCREIGNAGAPGTLAVYGLLSERT